MDKVQICLVIMAICVVLATIGTYLPRYGKYRWMKFADDVKKSNKKTITQDDILWNPAREFLNIMLCSVLCLLIGFFGFIASFICFLVYICKAFT
jgi:hypothetical protein